MTNQTSMNILPSWAWAILEPAGDTYLHQPAYKIIHNTINRTRTEAINSYIGNDMYRDSKWQWFKRRGWICRKIRVVGFSWDTPEGIEIL